MNLALGNRWQVSSFDAVVARFADSQTSFTEKEALKNSHWDLGEDALLREDVRFRPTQWGRWILSSHLLANDYLYRQFLDGDATEITLKDSVTELKQVTKRPIMFCSGDTRFICNQDTIRLAASELSDRPKLESPTELEKYVTHLPLHTLSAVAASEPAGEWGPRAQEELIETEGWLRVTLPGHSLNDQMFVARIKGNSMDNGKSALVNGAYAVFELWPSGTKQELIVLVRGAFKDPETGSYAVKKYVGDVRNEEGCHLSITLESLNSDKERYPDIVLSPEQDSDLAVVAKLIAPLSVDNFGREPKRRKASGRRDLSTPAGQKKVVERLSNAVDTFFEGPEKPSGSVEGGKFAENVWTARFVCMDAASGGLHIEAGPLNGLPPFAKKLLVSSAELAWTTVASNFRSKNWRISVEPSEDSYCWSAPGFEEDLEDDLKVLTLEGLSGSSVTLFRIDAAGNGLTLSGNTLSPGQSYRLLIPPSLANITIPHGSSIDVANSWRLIELLMPPAPDAALKNALAQCGLLVGKTAPSVSWSVVPPSLYRSTPSGESYPCFSSERQPIFTIQGIECESDGDVSVFLCGGGSLQSIPLPAGDFWNVECSELHPGNYMVEVLHSDKNIEPARLAFAVVKEPVIKASCDISAKIADDLYEMADDGSIVVQSDFSLFDADNIGIAANGPRLWPVYVTWESGKIRRLKITSLEVDGSFNVDELIRLTEDLRRNCRIANLVVDFRELGRLTIQLNRVTDPAQLAESLQKLVQQMAPTVGELSGQFIMLRNLWLDKVLQMLNYRIGEFNPDELERAPAGTTAIKLFETIRSHGEVREDLRRVLVLTTTTCDLRDNSHGSVRVFANNLCLQHEVVDALITDGMRWFLHRRGGKLTGKIWDFDELVAEESTFDSDDFLTNCAVGV